MALFGLATFRRATRPNIMECDYVASDPPIIVARICLALTAVFSVPVNHHPAREAVWSILSGGSREQMPSRVFFCETVAFFGLALLLGMFIKELSVAYALCLARHCSIICSDHMLWRGSIGVETAHYSRVVATHSAHRVISHVDFGPSSTHRHMPRVSVLRAALIVRTRNHLMG